MHTLLFPGTKYQSTLLFFMSRQVETTVPVHEDDLSVAIALCTGTPANIYAGREMDPADRQRLHLQSPPKILTGKQSKMFVFPWFYIKYAREDAAENTYSSDISFKSLLYSFTCSSGVISPFISFCPSCLNAFIGIHFFDTPFVLF